MGYGIKEVSMELGVSEKSILEKIKDDNFKSYIYNENGLIYIKDEGIKYILDNSSKEEMYIENITRIKEIEESKDNEIKYLNKEIEILKLEKEHFKDRVQVIEGLLKRREDEILRLKEKLKLMDSLEKRYNELYGKLSDGFRDNDEEKDKNKRKKTWIRF